MKIVIEIPDRIYKIIQTHRTLNIMDDEILENALKNGTPLPKGHGNLKDANKLKHSFIMWSMATQGNFIDADIVSVIDNSPTIIFADKGGKR